MKQSLHRKHLMLVAVMLASIGSVLATGPAVAQEASAKWKPGMETITVTAAPAKNSKLRGAFSGARLGDVFIAVSASIAVPYSDLNLAQEPGAAELLRRINVAARLVCLELDIKYPPSQYPVMEGEDCAHTAAKDGLTQANLVIAAVGR
jgi:UrcA family protein